MNEVSEQEPSWPFDVSAEKRRWILVSLAIVGSGVLGIVLLSLLKSEPTVAPQINRTVAVDADLLVPRSGSFKIVASGRVQAVERVSLQSQVSGDVLSVAENLKSGGVFKKGDVLLRINPESFRARVDELAAQRESAVSDIKLAQTLFDRTKKLVAADAASQEELDQRSATLLVAKSRIKQIDAGLNSARIDLSRAEIKAPFDGRVVSETVSVGDVIAPGAVFAEIYSTESFEVPVALSVNDAVLLGDIFNLSESGTPENIQNIQAELSTEFAGARFSWPAVVDRIEAGLDPATRTIDAVLRVDDPQQPGKLISNGANKNVPAPPLLPSMFVDAAIETAERDRFYKLRRDSIRADGSIWYVTPDQRNEGEVRILNTARLSTQRDWAFVTISGLQDGSHFMLGTDIGAVIPGNRIRVRNAEEQLAKVSSQPLADDSDAQAESKDDSDLIEDVLNAIDSSLQSDPGVESQVIAPDIESLEQEAAGSQGESN